MFTKKDKQQKDDIVGLLGNGTSFEGVLKFKGTVRIDGNFTGEIDTNGMVIIGNTAMVNAQIRAENIIIHGEMHGEVNAHKKLELKAGGKLFGNVKTSSLTIENGVIFNGYCKMVREEPRKLREAEPLPQPSDASEPSQA
ncbi:MAG: bactofilin family protein [Desulfomonilia bacterium]|jgi:cytoskeletal protein CcmA (bactofilin family)|uniref:Polymer-forming cytoskeletal n=1 Tax=anaerobic digester metagenome TaxID=1263854 RepID=A0A485M605_9ZZZZ|nr:polymer-forming cytoskeletal protein [Pseudomonadota bacterium]HON38241.1 polymer-forming cytoskeletal protein [Deltaproteobacteria bacterium]HRS56090.1 polymer-forming cytoskeletal protein [Desulfomonilia bacterium]HPD21528.1 polymer-forming cytoskeletal protein [Deltaproteobacteria bacterium]HPX18742.1 polymer-forming cytoskeletal protein [Deltaproteobacteria bacterium]